MADNNLTFSSIVSCYPRKWTFRQWLCTCLLFNQHSNFTNGNLRSTSPVVRTIVQWRFRTAHPKNAHTKDAEWHAKVLPELMRPSIRLMTRHSLPTPFRVLATLNLSQRIYKGDEGVPFHSQRTQEAASTA